MNAKRITQPPGIAGEIKLKPGESTTITLKGTGTAGYVWDYKTDAEDRIKVSKEFVKGVRAAQKNMGASADEVFTITALKKGIANISFSHGRSWEKNTDPADEKKIKIIVE